MIGCTGCFCSHQWVEASCLEPQTCPLCGKVEGEPLGHRWKDATCQAPQTCEACGETQGETVDHQWQDATCDAPKTCKWCALTEGEPLAHDWQNATTEKPKTCAACGKTEGERIITDERFTTAANQDLFGSWEMGMSMSGEELSLAEYVDEVRFVMTLCFGEDGTMEIKARFEDMDGFVAHLITVTEEMIYQQFEGMEITREDADLMKILTACPSRSTRRGSGMWWTGTPCWICILTTMCTMQKAAAFIWRTAGRILLKAAPIPSLAIS